MRNPESLKQLLAAIEAQLPTADPLKRLHLVQERLDIQAGLAANEAGTDLAELEGSFVAVAASYGDRNGITYTAWRELGVPASVLTKAGISHTT